MCRSGTTAGQIAYATDGPFGSYTNPYDLRPNSIPGTDRSTGRGIKGEHSGRSPNSGPPCTRMRSGRSPRRKAGRKAASAISRRPDINPGRVRSEASGQEAGEPTGCGGRGGGHTTREAERCHARQQHQGSSSCGRTKARHRRKHGRRNTQSEQGRRQVQEANR